MRKFLTYGFYALLAASILVLIYFRLELSLKRYFDIDEFAHLHWSYSFIAGEVPYRDFFYIFPPYFLIAIGSIIKLFGRHGETIIAVRGFIFFVQILSYLALFLWVKKLRNWETALLSVIIFIFLPLPSDKLLEIRPDLISTVLTLFGLYVFTSALERRNNLLYFLSGFLFTAGMAFVPKTVFLILPVVLIFIYQLLTLKKKGIGNFLKNYLFVTLGASVNVIGVSIFFLKSGNFWFSSYLISKLASDVTNTLALKFYMRPDIFFYPNDTYYGMGGINQVLITNLLVYLLGAAWGIKSLISSLSYEDKNKSFREFVFSLSYFVSLYVFVKIFPLKHLQYLIPTAIFISFYSADLLIVVLKKVIFGRIFCLGFAIYLTFLGWQMYSRKIKWTNAATIVKINQFTALIPPNEPVFDLTGETIFFKDGYYFCCLPYGQYEESLNFQYPKIDEDIEKRGTKYVYVGNKERIGVLPIVHQKYIMEHFEESGSGLMQRKKQ